MNRSRSRLLISFLALSAALTAAPPRTPLGIYAIVNITQYQSAYDKTNPCTSAKTFEAYINTCVYPGLLGNDAVSGIALFVPWANLNPNPPTSPNPYDWSLVQNLFDQVALWNTNNPTKPPKTIQLGVTPGFNSPQWLKNEIFSCDFLFSSTLPLLPFGTFCGEATFNGFNEGGVVDGSPVNMVLPMPWDPTYKAAWKAFLTELNSKYGSNPSLVSISVAGPTASSEEMILPTTRSTNASATQIGGLTPEQMWDKLLAYQYSNPAYQMSDQAFIDQWEEAINTFGSIFSGLTFTIATGDGLPNLTSCEITTTTTCTFSLPTDPVIDFSQTCNVANMDCAAETTILAYFSNALVGGPNAKSTQMNGMKGVGVDNYNLGVPGVKLVSQSTDLFTLPSRRILGGSQFNMSFSTFPVQEGCTTLFPPKKFASPDDVPVADIPAACLNPANTKSLAAMGFTNFDQKTEAPYLISPEQALYNVLKVFFDGTNQGSYFSASNGTAPLNYVQVYGPDIDYATANSSNKAPVVMGGTTLKITAQSLLNEASEALGFIAEYFH
jgi:hypothetical protein